MTVKRKKISRPPPVHAAVHSADGNADGDADGLEQWQRDLNP